MKWIIYTDLDGTLLDFTTYSYAVTENTVAQLDKNGIPVIFCSSKTRVEQEVFRAAMHLQYPFIVENGSAILIPNGFFDFDLSSLDFLSAYLVTTLGDYTCVILGERAEIIRKAIVDARSKASIQVEGYADLDIEQIVALTGLEKKAAKRAASRDFSETILRGLNQSPAAKIFINALDSHGLQCVSGGKFNTVMGKGSDKGKAVQLLNQLFEQAYGEIKTIGLGDSANDLPLLEAVDLPFLVQKPNAQWQDIDNPKVEKINAIGPEGWNQAIYSVFKI